MHFSSEPVVKANDICVSRESLRDALAHQPSSTIRRDNDDDACCVGTDDEKDVACWI
jgi:hypothetical protein